MTEHELRRGRLRPRHRLHRGPDHRGRPRRLAGRAGPLPAGRRAGLPVGEPRDHRAPAARPRGRDLAWACAGPTHDERSWTFDLDPGGRDPVLGIERLQEAYLARVPRLPARASRCRRSSTCRPARWSPTTSRRSPSTSRPSGPRTTATARPTSTRRRCATRSTRSTTWVYTDVNNGVYRCGFAGSQAAYERAYDRLFAALDWLEERLTDRRYLVGDTITEADVRLFTTLVRFDAVYHGHFKCNRQQADRDAGAVGATPATCSRRPGSATPSTSTHIKRHYYVVHADINPTRDRAEGPGPRGLAHPARPRGRSAAAVRRRDAAAPAARGRGRPRRPRGGLTGSAQTWSGTGVAGVPEVSSWRRRCRATRQTTSAATTSTPAATAPPCPR